MYANVIDERRRANGFTLLELVLVVLVLGILAIYVLPRFSSGALSGGLFRDQVAGTLRHAQKTATSHRRLVCASIGSSTLTLSIATSGGSTSCNRPLQLADGSAALESKDASIGITPAPLTLYFQPSGKISLTPDGSNTGIGNLSVGGLQVTIVGETGHVR